MREEYLSISGIALIIAYLIVIIGIFRFIYSTKYINDSSTKKYFAYGLYFKLIGSIGFALIYDLYYMRGGDTFSYFYNASRLGDVLFKDPIAYFKMLFDQITQSNLYNIDQHLGYMPQFRDPAKYAVHRYLSIFTILGLKNYYITGLCLNVFLYILNWKFFVFLKDLFPEKQKIIAICILFVPSVAFWSSGITKDPFTYSFSLIFVMYFYKIFIKRKLKISSIIYLLFSAYMVISLKPYIFYSLLISGFIWLGFSYVILVKSKLLRVFVFPILMLGLGIGGVYMLSNIASTVGGSYKDVDSMIAKAAVSQQDLKKDYYGGNSFNIGDYDASVGGAVSVTPAAILAGLYRPFIWESRSIVMLLSGLENLVLLLLTIFVLLRAGPIFFFKQLSKEPFLIFCFVFALIMAMGIGLSTSNFGALVRFKIPLIPFFLFGWLYVLGEWRVKKSNE